MQRVELEVSLRETSGKGAARELRARGWIPAVVYAGGAPPTKLQVEARRLDHVIATSGRALLDLKGPREIKGKLVLIKETQRDPVSRKLLHCDFYAVDVAKKIHVSVPLHFVGRPKGVEEGGILEPVLRELEVACLPLVMPEAIDVPVDDLGVGDSVHVRDLDLPEGVEALAEPDLAVVLVATPRLEEEVAPAEEEAEVAPAEPGEAPTEGEATPPESSEAGE